MRVYLILAVFLIAILAVFLIFLISGYNQTPTTNVNKNVSGGSIGTPQGKTNNTEGQKGGSIGIPKGNESVKNISEPAEEELPPGSIAIFYRTTIGESKDNLKGYQRTSDSQSIFETGFDINIDIESTTKGVIRYIPSVGWFDIMDTTTSYSYSEASIAPFTLNGRVFIAKTRGDRLKTTTITEIDPKNAESKGSVSVDGVRFAIVGNDVYYKERINENLYGDYSSGGELMRVSFGGLPEEVLSYNDEDNNGEFYSAGNNLISVIYDYQTQTDTIKLHDSNTGKVIKTLQSDVPTGSYISGDDALYQLVSVGTTYWISRYPAQGEGKPLLQLELDPDEKGLSIDQDKGKIMITSYNNQFKVIGLMLYDISTDELEDVEIEEFGSSSCLDYQFIVLD